MSVQRNVSSRCNSSRICMSEHLSVVAWSGYGPLGSLSLLPASWAMAYHGNVVALINVHILLGLLPLV